MRKTLRSAGKVAYNLRWESLAGFGLACVTFGTANIYPPAAWIVGGLAVITLALAGARWAS